jgi:hypothetical protein
MRSPIALAVAAGLAASYPLVGAAQAPGAVPPPGTMIVERVEQGLVYAPDLRITEVNDRTAALAGGYIGWMTDRTWLVGAGGYWLANQDDDLEMAYGGMLVQWLGQSDERIGFGVRGLVGGGRATLGSTVGEYFGGHGGALIDADAELLVREYFFVAEPQASVVLHFARWMRLEVGVGYRLAAGAGRLDDELSGAGASVAIRFGGTSRDKP